MKTAMLNIISVILTVFFMGACKKQVPINIPLPTKKDNLVTDISPIWIYSYTNIGLEPEVIGLLNNDVIIPFSPKLVNLDKITGALIDNLPIDNNNPLLYTYNSNSKKYLCNTNYLDGFTDQVYDYDSKTMLATKYGGKGGYKNHKTMFPLNDNTFVYLHQNNIDSTFYGVNIFPGQPNDTIFTSDTLWKKYYAGYSGMQEWYNASGDRCMVLNSMLIARSNGNNRIDVIVYNTTKKKTEWHLPRYDPSGLGGEVKIHDNKLYCVGTYKLYCFDLLKKKQVWVKDFYIVPGTDHLDGFVTYRDFEFDGNRMYLHISNTSLWCLDKNNGSTIWHNIEAGFSPTNLILHKGMLYYKASSSQTGTCIYGAKAADGSIIFRAPSPSLKKNATAEMSGWSHITLDPSTDIMYFIDKKYINAFSIKPFNQN